MTGDRLLEALDEFIRTRSVTESDVRRIAREVYAAEHPESHGLDWFSAVGGFRKRPPGGVQADDADTVVEDAAALLDAVTTEGATVWVPGDTTIDLTGVTDHGMASNVTLASDRDVPAGKPGGRLHTTDTASTHVFKSRADGIRVSGLRLEGPRAAWIREYDAALSRCFGLFFGADCTFDNLEVYGWPFAGLALGAKDHAPAHEVRHCHIHDNLMEGLGYGVELYNGIHTIHHCYFNRTRHAIAGFGRRENGYDAGFNVFGPDTLSHAADMHALEESTSETGDTAGKWVYIHDSVFLFTHDLLNRAQEAIAIRGVPTQGAKVERNHFSHDAPPEPPGSQGDAFRQARVDGWQNFTARDNHYDTSLSFSPR